MGRLSMPEVTRSFGDAFATRIARWSARSDRPARGAPRVGVTILFESADPPSVAAAVSKLRPEPPARTWSRGSSSSPWGRPSDNDSTRVLATVGVPACLGYDAERDRGAPARATGRISLYYARSS